MVEFLLGIVIGLMVATLIVVTLIFLKSPIERLVEVAKTKVELAGPRPKGFIFNPPEDELDEAREEIIEENRRKGKDTPIDDLRTR